MGEEAEGDDGDAVTSLRCHPSRRGEGTKLREGTITVSKYVERNKIC